MSLGKELARRTDVLVQHRTEMSVQPLSFRSATASREAEGKHTFDHTLDRGIDATTGVTYARVPQASVAQLLFSYPSSLLNTSVMLHVNFSRLVTGHCGCLSFAVT